MAGAACAFLLLYAGACLALFLLQRSLIYFPQPRRTAPPAVLTLPVAGAQLAVSAKPRAGPDALLYFGGNAEDVSANLPAFGALFPRHALYLVHYRGYGGSTGKPSERALVADALAAFDHVHASHPRVTVIGRSIGAAVALQLASARPVARLVLVTPHDSLVELAARQFPFFPVRWLLADKFESWRFAPQVRAPTLVLAAENDEVIPRAAAQQLYGRFAGGVALYRVIPDVGHNSISESSVYAGALSEYVNSTQE